MIKRWITNHVIILLICLYNITPLDWGCVAYNTLAQLFNYVLDNFIPTYLIIIYNSFCILNSILGSIIPQDIAFIHLMFAYNADFTFHSVI